MKGYCANCKHFQTTRSGEIWYDQYCGRVELPKVTDPVTGDEGYEDFNDLGDRIISNQKYPHARKINRNGQCDSFEPAP